ncbi:MAG: hypothetical protein B7C24_12200 [Bacteroidetes bacterium 4572_77]|nr:MAG: hypothetical protein B7C24_12200 [Bacteroidetes bacterium 4572_77]
MIIKDYYHILGIRRTASHEEVRERYLILARKYHPDLNPDNQTIAAKFAAINEAYFHLGDLDRRLEYHKLIRRNETIKEEAKRRLKDQQMSNSTKFKKKSIDDKLDDLLKEYSNAL